MAPYKSDAQRKFMHSQKPEIAEKWDSEGKKPSLKKMAKGRKDKKPSGGYKAWMD